MRISPVLVIDDDKNIRKIIADYLKSENYYVLTSESAEAGLEILKDDKIQVVIVDLFLPNLSGFDLIKKWKKIDLYDINFIVITAQGTTQNAIQAMKIGAYDYLVKPFDLDELGIVVERASSRIKDKEELKFLKETITQEYTQEELIIGQSKVMQNIYKEIGKIANTNATVLIEGESGTGKELIARTIHYNSKRFGKPFIAINTAAIPENLLESELFGHEAGAYTSADSKVLGKFQLANGGTIFLDEIGEIPLQFQAKLLRVIEEKKVTPLGGTKPVNVDIRIITATNKNLEKLVKEGKFREDLFYRLNILYLRIPPLYERKEDIPLLIEHFRKKFIKQHSIPEKTFKPEVIEFLKNLRWKGNVRELENTLLRILISTTGDIITIDDVKKIIKNIESVDEIKETGDSLYTIIYNYLKPIIKKLDYDSGEEIYKDVIREVEKALITIALEETKGNQIKASSLLGVNRNTIRKKIKELSIDNGKNHK